MILSIEFLCVAARKFGRVPIMDKRGIDETDRKILRVLRDDARLTTAQLAEAVGLSTTPCWNRVKRLEREGFIEGYVAVLNQEKLGHPDIAPVERTLSHHD